MILHKNTEMITNSLIQKFPVCIVFYSPLLHSITVILTLAIQPTQAICRTQSSSKQGPNVNVYPEV